MPAHSALLEPARSPTGRCQLVMADSAGLARPAAAERMRQTARMLVERYGLVLDLAGCQVYRSWVGTAAYPYQLCRVALQAPPAP